ncbi:hypothetical protein M2262_003164 [Pseudomonas sp. BIGb0408]|uniref:HNH endonuclease 5 domain-containing protein n=1 Tax=Phytopseudomonas flavescens TaxID=29435 RepID=A0A7Y9XL71_9GAMM|nr:MULTISPECIES: HNH endonuclease [Pseudomonas]MCW2293114.1 hypothetical protein [Pseudomonas sp. BIGb0408]NYH72316.1 hypothetical protein [Pseudomonas flavescens]
MPDSDQEDKKLTRICYLTGQQLKTPVEAYEGYLKSFKNAAMAEKTSKEPLSFGSEPHAPDRESLEHIIPNAIGGKLKSKNILSHAGNQKLNEDIDKEFVKVFSSFSLRLAANNDRKTKPSMDAFHKDHGVKVIFREGKFFPVSPFFDENSGRIYAHSLKNAENYRKHLISQGKIQPNDEIKLADDMAGEMEKPFGFDNKNFKQGMAKIAVGFAALKGLSREQLTDVLDCENRAFADKILFVPSMPTSPSEQFFEINITKSSYYPCHALTLCGHQGILFCHVELFSAFQCYIVLNSAYRGDDIFETYTYDLLDGQEISRDDYIASVTLPPHLPNIKNMRKLPPPYLLGQAEAATTRKEDWKSFNTFKFNQLSEFVNRYFVYHKAIELGLIKENFVL